jgi:hypothetical protein
VQILLDRVKDAFGTLSLDALARNSNEFLRLANESLSRQTLLGERELEGKKALIDASLLQIEKDLLGVQNLVTDLEKDREQKFGEVTHQLHRAAARYYRAPAPRTGEPGRPGSVGATDGGRCPPPRRLCRRDQLRQAARHARWNNHS